MCFTTSLEYGAAIACPFVLRYRITYPLCIRFCLRIGDYCLVNSLLDSAPPRGAGKMHTTSSSRHNNSSNNNQHERVFPRLPQWTFLSFLLVCVVCHQVPYKKNRDDPLEVWCTWPTLTVAMRHASAKHEPFSFWFSMGEKKTGIHKSVTLRYSVSSDREIKNRN